MSIANSTIYCTAKINKWKGGDFMMKVIKPEQAVVILKANGYESANADKIKMGLRQGRFPFGEAIQMSKNTVYDIFENLLMKWIAERSEPNDKEGGG